MKKNVRSTASSGDIPVKKAEATRARITAAARKVFARYPYHAASLRMIGAEGGFDHEIIRYHFASKATLFEAIMAGIGEDFYQANISFLEGLAGMPPPEGFARYLDRFIDYHYRHPEALRIIVLNMAVTENPDDIPGYHHIPGVLARTRNTFQELVTISAPADDLERFLNSFNNLLINYLATDYCQARALGMRQAGTAYREWVKKTMLDIFVPHLLRMIDNGTIGITEKTF